MTQKTHNTATGLPACLRSLFRRIPVPAVLLLGFAWMASPCYAQGMRQGAEMGVGALGLLALVVLFAAAIAGFSLIWRGLFPRKVEWTAEIARRMPWGSFFFGLVVTIVLLILIAVLAQARDIGGLFALLILIAYLILFAGLGISAVVEWAGETVDPAASGLRRALLGSGALVLLLLIPILGWAVLGGLIVMGVGAALLGYFPTRPATTSPPATASRVPSPTETQES